MPDSPTLDDMIASVSWAISMAHPRSAHGKALTAAAHVLREERARRQHAADTLDSQKAAAGNEESP